MTTQTTSWTDYETLHCDVDRVCVLHNSKVNGHRLYYDTPSASELRRNPSVAVKFHLYHRDRIPQPNGDFVFEVECLGMHTGLVPAIVSALVAFTKEQFRD